MRTMPALISFCSFSMIMGFFRWCCACLGFSWKSCSTWHIDTQWSMVSIAIAHVADGKSKYNDLSTLQDSTFAGRQQDFCSYKTYAVRQEMHCPPHQMPGSNAGSVDSVVPCQKCVGCASAADIPAATVNSKITSHSLTLDISTSAAALSVAMPMHERRKLRKKAKEAP